MSDLHAEIRDWLEVQRARPGGEPFGDGDSLLQAGVIDSVGMIDLISHLEQAYGVTVDDDDLTPENFGTVAAIVAYITSRRGGA